MSYNNGLDIVEEITYVLKHLYPTAPEAKILYFENLLRNNGVRVINELSSVFRDCRYQSCCFHKITDFVEAGEDKTYLTTNDEEFKSILNDVATLVHLAQCFHDHDPFVFGPSNGLKTFICGHSESDILASDVYSATHGGFSERKMYRSDRVIDLADKKRYHDFVELNNDQNMMKTLIKLFKN